MSQAFDDLVQRVNDLQTAQDDLALSHNELAQSFDLLSQNLDQADLSRIGHLTFPLDEQDDQIIRDEFPKGSIVLVTGAATVADNRVSQNSIIIISRGAQGGTLGYLYLSAQGNGTFTISSSSATETSTVNYLILN